MAFPLIFGFTPLGDGDLREETHELARRLEGEGAYSRNPDSAHDRELLAEAETAALGRQRLDAIDANLLPDQASELLAAWEDALDIPNNAARDADQRRARAAAYASLPRPAAMARVVDLLERLGLGGQANILGGWAAAHGGTVTAGQADPTGGTTAHLILDRVATMGGAYKSTLAYQRKTPLRGEVWLKKRDALTLDDALAKTVDYANVLLPPGIDHWNPLSGATVTTSQPSPGGGNAGIAIEDTSTTQRQAAQTDSGVYAPPHAVYASVFIAKEGSAGHFARIDLVLAGAVRAAVGLRLDTGETQLLEGTASEIKSIDVGGWWFVSFRAPGTGGVATTRLRVCPAAGTVASWPAESVAATGRVVVFGARIADAVSHPAAADPWSLTFTRLEFDDESGTEWATVDVHLGDGRVSRDGDIAVSATEESGWWRIEYSLAPLDTDEIAITVRAAAGLADVFPTTSHACTGVVHVYGLAARGNAILRSSRARVVQEDATPETILQSVVLVDDEAYDDPARARNIDILSRVLPARALGQWMREGLLDEMLVTSVAPTWGGSEKLGRTALGTVSPIARNHVRPPARYRDYGPYSRLAAADLNRIQDASLFFRDNAPSGTWPNVIQEGFAARFFDFTAAASTTVILDTSIDWRDRLVTVVLKATGTDVRPGKASQHLFNPSTVQVVQFYTGTGGPSYEKALTGMFLAVDSLSGALQLRNGPGVVYGAGMVVATGAVGGRTAAPASARRVFADGAAMPDGAWYDAVRDEVYTSRANGPAVQAYASSAGPGGLQRVGAIPFVERPVSGTQTYVLDTSADWRDRFVLTASILVWPVFGSGFSSGFSLGFGAPLGAGLGPAWPGAGDVSFTENSPCDVLYTGPGQPSAGGSDWGINLDDSSFNDGVILYAREEDGALCLDLRVTALQSAYAVVLMLHASEQLGVHTTPVVVPNPTPVDGQPIYPYELNALQDGSLMAQLSEGDVPSLVAPQSMPLGPLLTGPEPYLPAAFTVRARDGVKPEGTLHRRQRISGHSARMCTMASAANGSDVLIDSRIDWRDRMIFATGIWANVDVTPGAPGDTSYNLGTAWSGAAYTHAGKPTGVQDGRHAVGIATGLTLYVGDDTAATPGGLYLRNDAGATKYVGMQVFASPPLGPRSKQRE